MKKFALSSFFALALALSMVASTGMPAAADDVVSITGTVVSMTDQVFVLKTDQGDLTFEYDKNTVMPAGALVVGNRLTVSHDADDKLTNKMDARQIVLSPEPVVTPAPVTPAPTPEPTPVPEAVPQETAPAPQAEPEQLPATASPLPLIAIAGLLTLAGGIVLRKREGM